MTEDNVIYTNIGAAALLKCAGSTLKNSRSTGVLFGREAPQYIKMGRRVVYKRSDLLEWLEGFPTYQNTTEEQMDEAQPQEPKVQHVEPEVLLQEMLK